MDCLNHHERKALQDAWLGGEWEYRSKLGGQKTFAKLLEMGWIELFPGHNPNGDRFSITASGREARKLPPCPGRRWNNKLKELPSRLRTLK